MIDEPKTLAYLGAMPQLLRLEVSSALSFMARVPRSHRCCWLSPCWYQKRRVQIFGSYALLAIVGIVAGLNLRSGFDVSPEAQVASLSILFAAALVQLVLSAASELWFWAKGEGADGALWQPESTRMSKLSVQNARPGESRNRGVHRGQ